jgi:hypothetical protein
MVVRRQVEVEVQHFRAVHRLQEPDLDRLGLVGGVDDLDVGVVATLDRVERVQQHLAKTVGVHMDGLCRTDSAHEGSGDSHRYQFLVHHWNSFKFSTCG